MALYHQDYQRAVSVEKELGYDADASGEGDDGSLDADAEFGTRTAEKIVNEYGRFLGELNLRHKKAVADLLDRATSDPALEKAIEESLEAASGSYYRLFARKESASTLPYPRKIIMRAIRLLLKHESDPEGRALLRSGLAHLAYFE